MERRKCQGVRSNGNKKVGVSLATEKTKGKMLAEPETTARDKSLTLTIHQTFMITPLAYLILSAWGRGEERGEGKKGRKGRRGIKVGGLEEVGGRGGRSGLKIGV